MDVRNPSKKLPPSTPHKHWVAPLRSRTLEMCSFLTFYFSSLPSRPDTAVETRANPDDAAGQIEGSIAIGRSTNSQLASAESY
jgi:hypothetical protein